MSLNIFDPNLSVVELKYLIGKGVNVDVRNKRETPLMHHYNNLDKVKLLVEAGDNVNARDIYFQNIFFRPLSTEVLKFLIEAGANVNARDYEGITPLMHNYKSLDKVKLLVEAGADVNDKDDYGRTILFQPLSSEVLEYLIENGADAGITDKQGMSPLMSHYKSLDKVKLLVEAGVDLDNNHVLFKKDLPPSVLKYLIEAGINVTGDDWFKPLMSHIHSPEKFKLLLDAGADFNEYVLRENLPDPVFKLLVEAGADVNYRDYYGSILFKHRDSLTKVKLLVESGADISGLILFENLPDPVFEYLVKAGANINKRYKGESLLMYYRDNPERVNLLIEAGAMY